MSITVSLKTARKLKAAGYPQDKSVLVWVHDDSYTRKFCLALRDDVSGDDLIIAAPTVGEMLSQPEVDLGPYGGDFNSVVEAAADFWLRAKEGKWKSL